MATKGTVNVLLPARNLDLKEIATITANLMRNLGHTACHSGYNINYIVEDNLPTTFLVNAGTLEVHATAAGEAIR